MKIDLSEIYWTRFAQRVIPMRVLLGAGLFVILTVETVSAETLKSYASGITTKIRSSETSLSRANEINDYRAVKRVDDEMQALHIDTERRLDDPQLKAKDSAGLSDCALAASTLSALAGLMQEPGDLKNIRARQGILAHYKRKMNACSAWASRL